MSTKSFIYRHILIYRFLMDLLYLGKYKKRFTPVTQLLKKFPQGTRVLELCFGDIHIADFCKKKGFSWQGIDLNEQFVKYARKRGYQAYYKDLTDNDPLPNADVCIMMGSLYHFHPRIHIMIDKMVKAADTIIISEPVFNLSSNRGLVGFFARRAANAGKGNEKFRFNEASLLKVLTQNSNLLNYTIDSINNHGKDQVIRLVKNKKND